MGEKKQDRSEVRLTQGGGLRYAVIWGGAIRGTRTRKKKLSEINEPEGNKVTEESLFKTGAKTQRGYWRPRLEVFGRERKISLDETIQRHEADM